MSRYRGFSFDYWRKPIPTSAFDYDFVHEDYDGAPDSGDNRCGSGHSIKDCKQQIDEILLDRDEEPDSAQTLLLPGAA